MKENNEPVKGHKKENPGSKKSNTPEPSLTRFKKLFSGLDIEYDDLQDSKPKKKSTAEQKQNTESPASNRIEENKVYKYIQSNKNRIKTFIGAAIGLIFIISGLILISTSALRVVDNVIFGERAMFSAFLVLIGILILSTVFAKRLFQGTFLKKLHIQIQDHEESSKDKKDNIDEKDKK